MKTASVAGAVNQMNTGRRVLTENLGPGGSTSGALHGAFKVAKGAASLSGVGLATSVGLAATDLGIQAYRDAHDMTSTQVSEALNARQASFTANQWNSTQRVRRLYRHAKAANPGHAAVNPNVSDDAMRGGHLVVEDAGGLDTTLRGHENAGVFGGDRRGPNKPRFNLPSSHYPGSANVQSELQMPSTEQMNFGTALHGTTAAGHSWVQMEAHSGVWSGRGGVGRAYTDYALHGTDFARHKATGRQVGPLGTSPVMEINPLRVTTRDIQRSRIATAAANAARNMGLAGHAPGGPALTPLA